MEHFPLLLLLIIIRYPDSWAVFLAESSHTEGKLPPPQGLNRRVFADKIYIHGL